MSAASYEDEDRLLQGCIMRDPDAWSAFIRRYSALISISIESRAKMYGFTLSGEDIEDIRQNVLSLIWKDRKLESVKNISNISHWLAISSGNAAMQYLRRKRRHDPEKTVFLYSEESENELLDCTAIPVIKPDDELFKGELSTHIDKAIESLPVKEKLIMKLILFHEKKYHEIAEIVDLPAGTVSSYAKRAKEKLRRILREYKRFLQ